MSDMVVYTIGFLMGTFAGILIMHWRVTRTLKRMGLWILVDAFNRGASLDLKVNCEPLDKYSKQLLQRLIDQSKARGEVTVREEK